VLCGLTDTLSDKAFIQYSLSLDSLVITKEQLLIVSGDLHLQKLSLEQDLIIFGGAAVIIEELSTVSNKNLELTIAAPFAPVEIKKSLTSSLKVKIYAGEKIILNQELIASQNKFALHDAKGRLNFNKNIYGIALDS
jgi:hypothetical protein